MMTFLVELCLSVGFLGVVNAGGYCYTNAFDYQYCTWGCCKETFYDECCSFDIGLFVGCVVGSLALVSILVVIVCFCMGKGKRLGHVIQPTNTTTNITTIATNHQEMTSHPYGYGMAPQQPPGYTPYAPTWQTTNFSNPAMPPGQQMMYNPYPGSSQHPPPGPQTSFRGEPPAYPGNVENKDGMPPPSY